MDWRSRDGVFLAHFSKNHIQVLPPSTRPMKGGFRPQSTEYGQEGVVHSTPGDRVTLDRDGSVLQLYAYIYLLWELQESPLPSTLTP